MCHRFHTNYIILWNVHVISNVIVSFYVLLLHSRDSHLRAFLGLAGARVLLRGLLGLDVRIAETVPSTLHLPITSFTLDAGIVTFSGGAARLNMSANCSSTALSPVDGFDIVASCRCKSIDILIRVFWRSFASRFFSSYWTFSATTKRYFYDEMQALFLRSRQARRKEVNGIIVSTTFTYQLPMHCMLMALQMNK